MRLKAIKERNLLSESSPKGGYLVGIHSNLALSLCLSVFGKFLVNFTNTNISLSHPVHNREIWSICKGCLGGWYARLCPRYGGLFH